VRGRLTARYPRDVVPQPAASDVEMTE